MNAELVVRALALTAVVVVLCFIIIDDLRHYRIRNEAIVLLIVLFYIYFIVQGQSALLVLIWHTGFAIIVGVVLIGLYNLQTMGGGDVKLLATAFLWLGPEASLPFALALFACASLYLCGTKLGLLPFQKVNGRMKVPYGPSIAGAWLLTWLGVALQQGYS